MRFRLITYNIHKGIGGVDRRYDLQRIIDTLVRYDPDVVFLQEVDDGVPRSRHDRQVELLGEALDLPHYAFQRNVSLTQGHYGNAILSRYPLHDAVDLDLTVRYKKRRRALIASCVVRESHQRTVHLINCHLGLAGFERVLQLKKILDGDALRYLHYDTPVIIGGDFNDVWGTLGKRLLEPAGFEAANKAALTFPAVMPMRSLDKIFYRGALRFDHCFAGRSNVAREASDHLPVVADFNLNV